MPMAPQVSMSKRSSMESTKQLGVGRVGNITRPTSFTGQPKKALCPHEVKWTPL